MWMVPAAQAPLDLELSLIHGSTMLSTFSDGRTGVGMKLPNAEFILPNSLSTPAVVVVAV